MNNYKKKSPPFVVVVDFVYFGNHSHWCRCNNQFGYRFVSVCFYLLCMCYSKCSNGTNFLCLCVLCSHDVVSFRATDRVTCITCRHTQFIRMKFRLWRHSMLLCVAVHHPSHERLHILNEIFRFLYSLTVLAVGLEHVCMDMYIKYTHINAKWMRTVSHSRALVHIQTSKQATKQTNAIVSKHKPDNTHI